MAGVFKQKYTDRRGRSKQSAKWYVQFVDHLGTRRRLPGYADKKLSEELGRKLERLAAQRAMNQPPSRELADWLDAAPRSLKEKLGKWGLLDARTVAEARPVRQHLADFEKHLAAKNNCHGHVKLTVSRITSLLDGCGFVVLSDVSASTVASWLAEQRQGGAFGISTSNGYLTALKGFCRWLVKDRRASTNPVEHLQRLNTEPDVRRKRRSLSREDFLLLLKAAREGDEFRGFTGADRAMLYTTAAYTGLRASELSTLSERSFDFRSDPPTVTVEAAYSKHRRKDVLPVHPELAARLQAWLADRRAGEDTLPLNAPLWPGRWALDHKAGRMLKADLRAARKAWLTDKTITREERRRRHKSDRLKFKDAEGRQFDFHSLRCQFISDLGRAGVSLVEAQKLARHSDPKLTANHYTHLSVTDLSRSVGRLPHLTDEKTEAAAGA